ncbi:MAG TPA: Hsp20/alpha crystallin family protein, partial [Methanothrix sp.]|nr:Hsp20/alpha crystallin family protein [Methanothrix sp.]
MKSDSSGSSDLERVIGKAAVEAARMSSQASQAAKKILGDVTSEISDVKSHDLAAVDLMETEEELVALISLPGAAKESIDLRVTEDSLYIDAKATVREGKFLRREMSTLSRKREIKLPM